MNIITWNSNGWRGDALGTLLNEPNLDFLCVQESGDPHLLLQNGQFMYPHLRLPNWNEHVAEYVYNAYNVRFWLNQLQQTKQSLLIYVNSNMWTINAHYIQWIYYDYGGRRYWHERPILFARVTNNRTRDTLIIGNVHGPSSDYSMPHLTGVQAAATYLEACTRAIEALRQQQGANQWILIGDFNVTTEEYHQIMFDANYLYYFYIPADDHPQGLGRRKIDYMITSNIQEVVSSNYLRDPQGGSYGSDHSPVSFNY